MIIKLRRLQEKQELINGQLKVGTTNKEKVNLCS